MSEPLPARADVLGQHPRALSQEHKHLIGLAYPILGKALTYFGSLLRASGYEQEDAQQELLLVFTARLQGQHPYNAERAQLRTYLYMLTRSVLLNRIARRQRRARGLSTLAAHHRNRVGELDLEALFPGTAPIGLELKWFEADITPWEKTQP